MRELVLEQIKKLKRPVSKDELVSITGLTRSQVGSAVGALSTDGYIKLASPQAGGNPGCYIYVEPKPYVPKVLDFRPFKPAGVVRRPVYEAPGCTLQSRSDGRLV